MNLVLAGLTAQNVADLVMGSSGVVSVIFLVVLLFFGYYGISGVIRLKKEQYLIPHRLMYPNYHNGEDCKDPVEYMDYIMPRLTIFSVGMLLSGVLLLLSYFVADLRSLGFILALYVAPLIVYLWYNGALKKAAKKFW